jgi:hypothetical protein
MKPPVVYAGSAYCSRPGCEARFGPVADGIVVLPSGWWMEPAGWVRIPGTRKQTRRAVPNPPGLDAPDPSRPTRPTSIICPDCGTPSGPALIQHREPPRSHRLDPGL